jgi:hypothetical protein
MDIPHENSPNYPSANSLHLDIFTELVSSSEAKDMINEVSSPGSSINKLSAKISNVKLPLNLHKLYTVRDNSFKFPGLPRSSEMDSDLTQIDLKGDIAGTIMSQE